MMDTYDPRREAAWSRTRSSSSSSSVAHWQKMLSSSTVGSEEEEEEEAEADVVAAAGAEELAASSGGAEGALEDVVAHCELKVEEAEKAAAWGTSEEKALLSASVLAPRRTALVEARARLAAARRKRHVPPPATTDAVYKVASFDETELSVRVTSASDARRAGGRAGDSKVAVVLVPSLGGTSTLVELGVLALRLAALGYVCLRYDMRGTGRSQGAPSLGEPTAEVRDVGALAAWARRRFNARAVVAVGVSYGAVLSSAAAHDFDDVDGFAAISYPSDYVWYLVTPFYAANWKAKAKTHKPKLFVWGSGDVFASLPSALQWYDSLGAPSDLVIFKKLDPHRGHMFHTRKLLDSLADHIEVWLSRTMRQDAQAPAAGGAADDRARARRGEQGRP